MSIFDDPGFMGGPDHWPENTRYPDERPPVRAAELPGLKAVTLELQAIGPSVVAQVSMGGFAVSTILSALQLALLQPSYAEASTARQVTEGFARYLESCLVLYPALAQVAAAGWDRSQDVTPVTPPSAGLPSDLDSDAASRFLNSLTLETREMIEREAQERMPAALRERLEAYYEAGRVPGNITVAALDAARREVVAERLRDTPND